jgi:hypothetical protein
VIIIADKHKKPCVEGSSLLIIMRFDELYRTESGWGAINKRRGALGHLNVMLHEPLENDDVLRETPNVAPCLRRRDCATHRRGQLSPDHDQARNPSGEQRGCQRAGAGAGDLIAVAPHHAALPFRSAK